MILYENTVENFLKSAENRSLIRYIIGEYEDEIKGRIDPLLKLKWKYMLNIIIQLIYFSEDISDDCGIRLDLINAANHQDVLLILASESDSISNVLVVDLLPWEEVRSCEEEDMIYYDDGDGEGEKKTIHPSFQLAATTLIRFLGIDDESVNLKVMALLYDCEYTRERDIVSHYNSELIENFPTYYINQEDKIRAYVRDVVTGNNGAESLRRLKFIGSTNEKNTNLLYPEQKLIFSTVKNYLKNDEIAWLIVKNPSGTGGSTLLNEIKKEAVKQGKDILLIDKDEEIDPEKLPSDRIVIWLYDDYEETGFADRIRKTAEEKKIFLHSLKLDESVAFKDGGKGLNWLERYLQMDTDKKLHWDPDQYSIMITDNEEEHPEEDGYASVVIKNNIYYDPETQEVHGSRAAKKAVSRKLSKGTKGVYIYPEDPALREYLKKAVADAQNRFNWLTEFVNEYNMDGEQLQNAQTGALNNESVSRKYADQAIRYMGQSAWNKLEYQSKTWIVSGLLAYHDMKKYDQTLDFSGVCISICKAVETELGNRLFGRYQKYLTEKYGDEAVERAPYALIEDKKGNKEKRFLEGRMFSLGSIPLITGIGRDGKGASRYAWEEFEGYCRDVLLIDPDMSRETMEEHQVYTEKIRLDYRNQAAHNNTMDVVQAKECIDYVVGVMHRLGVMLDAYRF